MNETWWRDPEQLDDDQKEIVALPLEGSHLVTGPPGSGKTNLLLLRATFLSRAGMPNIVILTFNRVLREFLITGAGNYPFEPDRIQTFRSWSAAILRSNGIEVDLDCDFDEQRARIVSGLDELAKERREELKLDCVLIDEAQDYFNDELGLVRAFSREVFAVGDDNQRIYQPSGSLNYLRTFCKESAPLEYHYRNGLAICRMADGIMGIKDGGMVDTCNYDESKYPSTVSRITRASLPEQVKAAIPTLQTQILAYPGEWIGVLAPRRADVGDVYETLLDSPLRDLVQMQRFEDGYSNLDADRPIVITTMHSAKGLEFRAVHLFALENVRKLSHDQRIAYTAVTRAKTSLSIYHTRSLPGYLEAGLVAANGLATGTPVLADLFGKA